MSYRWSITVAAFLMIGGIGTAAAEPPSYEVAGFSVTPHQLVVLGPAGAEQELPAAVATTAASPHQLAVMTPRRIDRQEHAQIFLGTVGQVR
jgi:hypothetical protein